MDHERIINELEKQISDGRDIFYFKKWFIQTSPYIHQTKCIYCTIDVLAYWTGGSWKIKCSNCGEYMISHEKLFETRYT